MNSAQVHITAGSCHLTLNLPVFFEVSTLLNIRKALSLLTVDPYANRETVDALGYFLGGWLDELREDVAAAKAGHTESWKALQAVESKIACFGSMASKELLKEHTAAKRERKRSLEYFKGRQLALTKAEKIQKHFKTLL